MFSTVIPAWLPLVALILAALLLAAYLAVGQPISAPTEAAPPGLAADYHAWPTVTFARVGPGLLDDLEGSFGPIAPPLAAGRCLSGTGCKTDSRTTASSGSDSPSAEPTGAASETPEPTATLTAGMTPTPAPAWAAPVASDPTKTPNCPPPSQGRACREP